MIFLPPEKSEPAANSANSLYFMKSLVRASVEPGKKGLPETEPAMNNRFTISENWSYNEWLLIRVGPGRMMDEE